MVVNKSIALGLGQTGKIVLYYAKRHGSGAWSWVSGWEPQDEAACSDGGKKEGASGGGKGGGDAGGGKVDGSPAAGD